MTTDRRDNCFFEVVSAFFSFALETVRFLLEEFFVALDLHRSSLYNEFMSFETDVTKFGLRKESAGGKI